MALEDKDWWTREYEKPAWLHYLANRRAPTAAEADSESKTAGSAHGHVASTSHPISLAEEHRGVRSSITKHRGSRIIPSDARMQNGRYVTNKRGIKICPDFQRGACQTIGSSGCAADSSCVHQCDLCLAQGHGGQSPHCPKNSSQGGQTPWIGGKGGKYKGNKGHKGKSKGSHEGNKGNSWGNSWGNGGKGSNGGWHW